MHKSHIIAAAVGCLLSLPATNAETSFHLYDMVTYYDGYLVANIPEDAPDEGTDRLYTYLNTVRLTDDQLDRIGEHLKLYVDIHAACDNYDRIGSVNLAFIPKGRESYSVVYDDDVDPMRIEIARFITPFMNKNKQPDAVPYAYQIDNLSAVLRDPALRAAYDVWVELEVFGVPYAAQQQVAGCAGCNDVFRGSLWLVTDDEPAQPAATNVFVPIVTRRSDWRADRGMNNYNAACTDEIGRTIRTFTFDVPVDVASGRVVIIMSNHGAGTNGEEYVRRMHYASFDGEAALEWKPGRQTCEPYRKFNTQSNGIYGPRPRTDERWQSFSNWCPGASIPYRSFETGPLAAGQHSVTIEVPEAEFYGSDGYFPVSVYFQGDTECTSISEPTDLDATSGIESVTADDYTTTVRVSPDGFIDVTAPDGLTAIELYDIEGRFLFATEAAKGATTARIPSAGYTTGLYILAVQTPLRTEAHKLSL